MRAMQQVLRITTDDFYDRIIPADRPVVLPGICRHWPFAMIAASDSSKLIDAMANASTPAPIDYLHAAADQQGRFHYSADGKALNFERGRTTLRPFLAELRDLMGQPHPPSLAVQGVIADTVLPGFSRYHPMPLVPAGTVPRLWIGTAAKVATHNDPVDNIAVVVAGRRRFTLFPPSAEDLLSMGPAHPTPAGTPVSMVHVTAPDLTRYPRFADALEVAEEAELAPGDAIYIPRNWYHHVEAIDRFNMLANYWWDSQDRPNMIAP